MAELIEKVEDLVLDTSSDEEVENTDDISVDEEISEEEVKDEETTEEGSDIVLESDEESISLSVGDEDEKSGKILSDDEDEDENEEENKNIVDNPLFNKNKRKRYNPDKWLKEVKYYQKTTNLLIPKAPFRRLVREIGQDIKENLRYTEDCFDALQTAAEDYIINILSKSQLQAIHRGCETIETKDIRISMQ